MSSMAGGDYIWCHYLNRPQGPIEFLCIIYILREKHSMYVHMYKRYIFIYWDKNTSYIYTYICVYILHSVHHIDFYIRDVSVWPLIDEFLIRLDENVFSDIWDWQCWVFNCEWSVQIFLGLAHTVSDMILRRYNFFPKSKMSNVKKLKFEYAEDFKM
jgi:hypothetical protein